MKCDLDIRHRHLVGYGLVMSNHCNIFQSFKKIFKDIIIYFLNISLIKQCILKINHANENYLHFRFIILKILKKLNKFTGKA